MRKELKERLEAARGRKVEPVKAPRFDLTLGNDQTIVGCDLEKSCHLMATVERHRDFYRRQCVRLARRVRELEAKYEGLSEGVGLVARAGSARDRIS